MDNLRKQADMTETTCSIEACDRPVKCKGLCSAHYLRKRRGIPLTDKPLRGSVITETCIVEECGRKTHLRGWCQTHYKRWRIQGAAEGDIESRTQNAGNTCAVDMCDLPARNRGWCQPHYLTWWKSGEVADRPIRRFNWAGDDVTYSGVHERLRRLRGDAADHTCVDCNMSALHWSYDHMDPDERLDQLRGLAYSTNLSHYDPRCAPCHYRFDRVDVELEAAL